MAELLEGSGVFDAEVRMAACGRKLSRSPFTRRTFLLGCFVSSVKGNYKPPAKYVTVTSVFFAASTVIS
jgi:hypothetical protein